MHADVWPKQTVGRAVCDPLDLGLTKTAADSRGVGLTKADDQAVEQLMDI
jgi:hypothetical protein